MSDILYIGADVVALASVTYIARKTCMCIKIHAYFADIFTLIIGRSVLNDIFQLLNILVVLWLSSYVLTVEAELANMTL